MKKIILISVLSLVSLCGFAQSNQKAVVYLKNATKVETLSKLVDSLSFVEQKGVLRRRAVVLNHTNNKKTLYAVSNLDSIRFLEPATAVITQSITDLTANSITCNGVVKITDGSTVFARGFVWSKSTNPTYETNLGKTTNGNQSGEYSATISGLSTGIRYYVRAYAITDATLYYGDVISFNLGTLPTVTTNALTGVYSTTAIGGATIGNSGSPITASGLVWAKTDHPTIQSNTGMTINGKDTTNTSEYISDLTPMTNYFVRAYASNYYGTSYGNAIPFKTNSDPDIVKNISTKAEMKIQVDNLYNFVKNNELEAWTLDMLNYSDMHADNAYSETSDYNLAQLEQQNQDRKNMYMGRDWESYYRLIRAANKVICNIDLVPDATLTLAERKQWKSEALIFRSMIYFDLVRLWGAVPLVITEVPTFAITNYAQGYHLYFPKRDSVATVYRQIIKDLNLALETGGAPAIDQTNKFKFSKTVANALLAKIYAEKPVRDYAKTVQYCAEVEKDVSLVANYGDLFDMNATNTDVKYRNSSESIFEITFPEGGNWVTWMYGKDVTDPTHYFSWSKWCTPSRDLINAFDSAGDITRKIQTITTADATWSNHYPSKDYPFMYKYRSKYHSIIKLRLADILLLKAEALVEQGNLADATTLVNRIRTRANLGALISVNADDVLNERRLELAFEGQRWFDLVRTGKVSEVMNSLNIRDIGRLPMYPVTEAKFILPVPQPMINENPLLDQNPGYDGKPVYPKSTPSFDKAEVTQTVINFGDDIDLQITVSDLITPLFAVKVNVIIENKSVISTTIATSGNTSNFHCRYRIPLVEQAKENTDIKISLTSTNIAGYSKDTVFSTTKANRLPMPDLYIVPDFGQGATTKLTLVNADSMIYSATGLTFSKSFSYKLATKIDVFKQVDWTGLVFGKVGNSIGLIEMFGKSLNITDEKLININSFTFDAYQLTVKVGGKLPEPVKSLDVNLDLPANPATLSNNTGFRGGNIYFGENVEVTFSGITADLANSISPDYFEVTGTNTAKFIGKSGLYKAYFLVIANYLYIEPQPEAIYPEALWICGTGFGRPSSPYIATSSWNWNSPMDYMPCRLVSPGIYQVTMYCKNAPDPYGQSNYGSLDFKFFHKRGWWDGHEELANLYTVSAPFLSTAEAFGDMKVLSETVVDGVYRITLNQNDMTINAVKLK